MRFSTTALLALPLLAAAAESPFEQYRAKFQNFLSSFGASVPGSGAEKAAEAPAAASSAAACKAKTKNVVQPKHIATLTLENWKDTLYGPVKAEATQPEPWLVLVSGRNKTCFGRCGKIDAAFNESASKFAALPPSQPSPHLGYVNCDDQPVLCNSWSANTGGLWLFEMLPAPAPVDIHTWRLNLTTTTAQDIVDAFKADKAGPETRWRKYDSNSYFHPFDGKLTRWGLAVPLGYVFWVLNVIPSWGMMLVISFISRRMVSRRINAANRQGGAPAAGAPRAAPAGDGRS
ncbi:1c6da8ab-e137-4869-8442-15a840e93508 [Thermothielavioides terrestris]|uniref:Peptidyl-tRNA hydrolase n=2 Tax=Thermothielavioides terrestris TaxID=2587410 RepID=G2RFZ6_THETT|nr:uncharacterized protein THITE_2059131 [Thermothielavioides terrestris NRRL 8126]AEO71750.1 hypothetical protein THITE_2059131 [Thermothielavioides terrestris NRRL 8126]SPQ27264.1 1c6da8ab-e137-4869-8442-15a840e93508 [Thermothielavioides terrestris]